MSLTSEALGQVLANHGNNGIYHLPSSGVEAVREAALAQGMVFCRADLADVSHGEAVLEKLAAALQLPEWFGNNFDALYDCLTDLTWQDTAATVIVLSGVDTLYTDDPEAWQTLLSVFASAAEFWQNDETPFWVFVDMHADGLAHLPTFA